MAETNIPDLFVPISYGPPPSMMAAPGKKDKKYRTDMLRSFIGSCNSDAIRAFRYQYLINSKFVSGDQWVLKEDINTFLNDADGAVRNRIKANINIMRQVVEKYRGTAAKMTFNASVRSISPLSKTRKDEAYAQMLFYHGLAQGHPALKTAIKSAFPIGDSEDETASIFENTWVDSLSEGVGEMVNFIAELNRFDRYSYIDAQDMALSGACASIGYGSRKHMMFDRIRPDELLFDTQAQLPDLSDASWLGRQALTNPSQIFEQYSISTEEMRAIEETARNGYGNMAQRQQFNLSDSRNPLWQYQNVLSLEGYWRDGMWREYGYVRDITGEPMLECINYIPPDSPPDYRPKYTDNDLIKPDDPQYPKTQSAWKLLKGQAKTTSWSEVIRWSRFVPWEYLCGRGSEQRVPDIELDGGVYDLQEYNPLESNRANMPIKVATWAIEDGRIIAPVSDTLSPQRLFNRCLSVIESRLNNSGGVSPVIDTSMLDQSMTPKQAAIAMKNGTTVFMDTNGRGVPQAVGEIDTGISSSTQALFGVMGELLNMARFVSATPEGVTGQAGGDTLVRVNNANIQGANLLDEVFYAALEDLSMQKYQMAAMAGKNWYAQRPEVLEEIVGNGNAAAVLASKDILLENFRVFVKRDNPEGVKRQQADQMIMLFLQLGLLGQEQVAAMYNVATPEQVTRAAKQHMNDLRIAQKEAQRQQQAQMQAQNFAARDMELRANEAQLYRGQVDAAKADATMMGKRMMNYDRAAAQNAYPDPDAQVPQVQQQTPQVPATA